MIYYRGSFADIDDDVYVVDIQVKNLTDTGEIHELKFNNDTPVKITTKSDGLFGAIKSRGCTISLLTSELLFNIWSSTSQGVEVNIYNTNGWPVNMETADIPATYTNIFHGFLTPCAYTQGYSESIETLEIEAVEAISTLKDIDYTPYDGTNNQIVAFKYILKKLLYDICGYSGKLYFPRSFSSVDGSSLNRYSGVVLIDSIAISESNFFDDDETHTPWKCYDVLEEMMKFLNCSLVPVGNDIWIIDYNYVNAKGAVFGQQGTNTQYYKVYDLEDITSTSTFDTSNFGKIIDGSSYAEGGQTITLDDVYNKISLSENTYPVEEIIPDIEDAGNLINTNVESGLGVGSSIWTQTSYKYFLWWTWDHKPVTTATDYQMFNRLDEVKTGWKHHFYKHYSGSELHNTLPYHDTNSQSEYTSSVNAMYNTLGCLLQNYAFVKNSDNIPSKLDWKNYLTFFCLDDTTIQGLNTSESIINWIQNVSNHPVLEYTSKDAIVYRPKNGNGYITFNAKLWYQQTKSGVVKTVNDSSNPKIYKTNPIEDVIDTGDPFLEQYPYVIVAGSHGSGAAYPFTPKRTKNDTGYKTGFKMLKLRLQIGNYYWNGSSWTTNPSDFIVNFNNNPQPDEDEKFNCLEWMTPVYNTTYEDGIGKDCVKIPINANISGTLKFTIYPPYQWDQDGIDKIYQFYNTSTPGATKYLQSLPFASLCQCIYMKDLELNYVYVDNSPWWLTKEDDKSDIEYTNLISNENVINGDEIELKVNSWFNNKPISRSYVVYSNRYIDKIGHSTIAGEQKQEENIINNYYNHYSAPKIIYNCKIKEYYSPYNKIAIRCLTSNRGNENTANDSWTNDDFKFMVDTQEWDVKNKTNQIQLIQY